MGGTVSSAPNHLLCFEVVVFCENAYRFLGSGQWPCCLDRKCTGISDTNKSGVEVYGWIYGSEHECDNLYITYNTHQKAFTIKEALNHQVYKRLDHWMLANLGHQPPQ